MLINSFKVLFFFLLLIEGFYAQDEIYRNYTVEDGLPSSEVYYSFQDSKGYMWFATDAGVSRFNGYEFENFTTKNGLTDNTVFKITEDSRGRIWFAPFNGRICYYTNDTIIEPPFIKKNSLGSLNYLESFYVDSLDNVWIGSLYSGILCISKEGKQQQMITLPKDQSLRTKVIKVESEMIVGSLISSKGMKALQSSHLTSLKFYKDTLIEEVNPVLSGGASGIQKVARGNNFACYLKSNNLYIIDEEGRELSKKLSFLDETRVVYLNIKGGVLYLGAANKGLYKFRYKGGKLELLKHEFEKYTISSVFIDNAQGIWYTSLSNGVYYLPLKAILKNQLSNQQVYEMAVDKKRKKLYVSLNNGNLIEVSDSIKKIEKLTRSLFSIYFNDEKGALYWARDKNEELIKYKNEEIEEIRCLKEGSHFKSMLIKGKTIFYVNSMGLNIVTDTSWYSSYNDKESKLWCTSLAFHCGKLWVGTNEGLRTSDGKSIKEVGFSKDYLNLSITSMLEINDSTLAIGTKERGLLLIENEKIKVVLDQSKGVASDLIRCVDKDRNGLIWCGTNKGLTRIQKNKKGKFYCYNITKKHGLTSEDIISVKSLDDSLFVGTSKGVLVINSKGLEPNSFPPRLYYNNFLVNSLEKAEEEVQFLKSNENNITISYLGLNYRSQGEVNYRYRLIGEGTDTNWISTYSRSVQYTLLPPSDYIFEVKARNEDGFWSDSIKKHFIIYPPYWKTWWFIVLTILSFSSLLFWILYAYFKRRESKYKEKAEKIELEKKMIELELKALRSQMNPHFIFNILNSIQHFMLQNNFKETNSYLTQFAKLIRIVLNLSEKSIITIGEELEMLRLYMNLEKMRFENGFDYEIILGDEIDEDYDEIPSMLIQPYVENAIWHGLMNKKSKGKIFISIEIQAGNLFCIIEDNGIGLKKSKEIASKRKKMKHKSVGMRITENRLDLLNDNNNINIHVIELETIPPHQKKGTRVEIKIPYNS